MQNFSLASDSFNSEEIDAAINVLKSGFYTMGSKVKEFENAFAKKFGAKHAVMVNSGSSANLLMVEALLRRSSTNKLTLNYGDEVLVPALAWSTTIWPLVQLGLKPVFVDVCPKTLAIDTDKAQEMITSKTKAMFLIHVLGKAADMKKTATFCEKHSLILLEDCCETLGAYSNDKMVGNFGMAASFSHFFSHHLTTIEGGTILTNDTELYNDLKSFRAHGWVRERDDIQDYIEKYPEIDPRFMFISTGYNVRPTEIQAAIGLVQLEKIDAFIEARISLAKKIHKLLETYTPWLKLNSSEDLFNDTNKPSNTWMNLSFINTSKKISTNIIRSTLEESGVETRPIIAGNITKHPAMDQIEYKKSPNLEVSDKLLKDGFMIGCNPDTSDQQIETLKNAFLKLSNES